MILPHGYSIFTAQTNPDHEEARYALHFLARDWSEAEAVCDRLGLDRKFLGQLDSIIELTPDGPMTQQIGPCDDEHV